MAKEADATDLGVIDVMPESHELPWPSCSITTEGN